MRPISFHQKLQQNLLHLLLLVLRAGLPPSRDREMSKNARQYFIGVHNETLSVAAMRVNRFGSFVFKLRKCFA